MNRTEFLARLRRALAGKLPEAELSDVLAYYEEYFADAGADGEAAESFLDDVMTLLTESETVVDLPRELYVVCPEYADKSVGRSSEGLRFDFWVEEPMEMRLEVVQRSGSLELGIQNREDGSWPYAQRPFTGEATDAVTLRPGSYSVMVEADAFQGSWHIQGEPVPAP